MVKFCKSWWEYVSFWVIVYIGNVVWRLFGYILFFMFFLSCLCFVFILFRSKKVVDIVEVIYYCCCIEVNKCGCVEIVFKIDFDFVNVK